MLKVTPTRPPWTPQQEAIFEAARAPGNLMVAALAGTGKTRTLEQIQLASRTKPILYLVFNRKNAEEAREQMLSTTVVKTFNGAGLSVWGTGRSITQLDVPGKPNKTRTILREIITESPKSTQSALWSAYDQVVAGVNLAKSLGYVPAGQRVETLIAQSTFHSRLDESPDDLVSDLIDAVLRRSITSALAGTIDFNDQVYMPALWGGTFPRFPQVMVDEYQDLSPVNHLLLARLTTRRLIGVGDEAQSIYGFRGAVAGGMSQAIATYAMNTHELSVSFRCPSAIVSHVHWRVPTFQAHRKGGNVQTPDSLFAVDIPPDATIICRNNAPLFALAFRLIAAGHSVSVSGSDIGPRMVAIMKRLGDEDMSRAQTLSAINDWEAEKVANESKTASDMAECMRVFARHGDSLGQALLYAQHLFAQTGSITLLTGHKAKGLEWPYVIHLDPWLCGDAAQDQNLRYVISTRSQDTLIEINSDQIQW